MMFLNRNFKVEIRRAILSLRFLAAVLIALVFLGFGVIRMIFVQDVIPAGYSFADLWYFAYSASYFAYLLPLLAIMPYADSLSIEREEGFFNLKVFRGKFSVSMTAKILANALAGAAVIVIPLLLLYLFANLYLPRAAFPLNEWEATISGRPYGILYDFYMNQPDRFIFLIIGLAGMMGLVYASFSMAVSLIFPQRYLVWALPCAFYLLSDFVAQKTRLLGINWSPVAALYASPWNYSTGITAFFLHPVTMLCLTVFLILLFCNRTRIIN